MRRFLGQVAAAYVALLSLLLAAWLVTPAPADTLSIPNTFSPGTTISSSQMNANFNAIASIVNGTIDDNNLENNGITGSSKLINGTVTLAKLASDSVDSSKIVNNSIQGADILDGTVASADITDNSVASGDILDGTIAVADLSANIAYQLKNVTSADGISTGVSGGGVWASVATVTFTTATASAAVDLRATVEFDCSGPAAVGLRLTYDCGGGATLTGVSWEHDLDTAGTSNVVTIFDTATAYTDNTSCTFALQMQENDADTCTIYGYDLESREWPK